MLGLAPNARCEQLVYQLRCKRLLACPPPAQMMADEPDRPAWRGMLVSYDRLKPLAGSVSPALLQCAWKRLHSACKRTPNQYYLSPQTHLNEGDYTQGELWSDLTINDAPAMRK